MKKAYEEYEKLNQEKLALAARLAFSKEILGITAHNLRGPAGTLAGIEERLEEDVKRMAQEPSQERRNQILYEIMNNIRAIESAGKEVCDQTGLLSLEGITPEEIKKHGRKFKVDKKVKNTYRTFTHKLIRKGLSILLEYPQDIKDYEVHTDLSAFNCITSNLIRNAIQYAVPESVIKSMLYIEANNFLFELENMVPRPIDTDLITKIFESGFRLETSDPSILKGNEGIGLYWVQEIIKQGYSGNIEITSGNKFKITEERTNGFEKKVYGAPFQPSYETFPSFHAKVSIPLEALSIPIKQSKPTIEDFAKKDGEF